MERRHFSLVDLAERSEITPDRLKILLDREDDTSLEEGDLLSIGLGMIIFQLIEDEILFTYPLNLRGEPLENVEHLEWMYGIIHEWMPEQGEIDSVEDLLWEISLNRESIVESLKLFTEGFSSSVIYEILNSINALDILEDGYLNDYYILPV